METQVRANFIEDQNRFSLPTPPDWWLKRLFDFDHMLVIMPSRQDARYLLGRRRQHSIGLGDVAMLDNKHPDTNLCYEHGVIPIAPLNVRKGAVNPFTEDTISGLIAELRRRDTWALSGGADGSSDAVVDAIEAREREEARLEQKRLWDDFAHRARDGYRSLTARLGRRNKRASDYHGVARPKPITSG